MICNVELWPNYFSVNVSVLAVVFRRQFSKTNNFARSCWFFENCRQNTTASTKKFAESSLQHNFALHLTSYLSIDLCIHWPTYHKSTYTGLPLNLKSFTSLSYKISLFKCLIDRSFNIFNNWNSFLNDIENIKSNLIKNAYPPFLIDKV